MTRVSVIVAATTAATETIAGKVPLIATTTVATTLRDIEAAAAAADIATAAAAVDIAAAAAADIEGTITERGKSGDTVKSRRPVATVVVVVVIEAMFHADGSHNSMNNVKQRNVITNAEENVMAMQACVIEMRVRMVMEGAHIETKEVEPAVQKLPSAMKDEKTPDHMKTIVTSALRKTMVTMKRDEVFIVMFIWKLTTARETHMKRIDKRTEKVVEEAPARDAGAA